MILAVFGTTGELIKLAPVLRRLQECGERFLLATTGQQVTQIPRFLEQLELPQPDVWLAHGSAGHDLSTSRDIPAWLGRVVRSFARTRSRIGRQLRQGPGRSLVLVHGDTMTTVLGALMGRALHTQVAHVESGLRSGDIRNPFPEELNRHATSRLASIHYAPGSWAASNLCRGTIVDTGSNTIRDALELVPLNFVPTVDLPATPFGVVSLHRFELLNSREILERTLEALAIGSKRTPMVFIDHPVTVAAIKRFGLSNLFDATQFVRIPRLRFFDFVQLERRCAFVVTDSGGSQEECYYLDRPCLVHRRRTERVEGLGETTVLSRLDSEPLIEFLNAPEAHRRVNDLPEVSPSDVIVSDLRARGFVSR